MCGQLLLELFLLSLLAIQIEKRIHYVARRIPLFTLMTKIELMRIREILMEFLGAYLGVAEVVLSNLLVEVVVCWIDGLLAWLIERVYGFLLGD